MHAKNDGHNDFKACASYKLRNKSQITGIIWLLFYIFY
ncbi:MAG: hypothetical protein IPL71_11495 [Anaerolineales bacterium]|nr:hypothetical protein [Anaerolineales bacterium]